MLFTIYDLLFEFQFQPDDEHTSGGVEGILSGGRVDATIHFVEKVVNADTRFHKCPFRAIEGMCGVEVPDAIARRILVSACIIGFGLQAPIQIDV